MANINWENLPSTSTPINATNLNKVGDGLVNVGTSVDSSYKINIIVSKNLFDGVLELGSYDSSGNKGADNAQYRNANRVSVMPNTTYTTSINGTAQQYVMYYYNASGTFLSSADNRTGTFTTPANCYYVNFRCYNADYTSNYATLKVQLEKGSVATSYQAYIAPSIYANDVEIYGQGTILYYDANGSNGSITLSDYIKNYKFIDIYYATSTTDTRMNFQRYDVTIGTGGANLLNASVDSGHGIYIRSRDIYLSGNTIVTDGTKYTVVIINASNQVTNTSANEIYIRKVIGYKE